MNFSNLKINFSSTINVPTGLPEHRGIFVGLTVFKGQAPEYYMVLDRQHCHIVERATGKVAHTMEDLRKAVMLIWEVDIMQQVHFDATPQAAIVYVEGVEVGTLFPPKRSGQNAYFSSIPNKRVSLPASLASVITHARILYRDNHDLYENPDGPVNPHYRIAVDALNVKIRKCHELAVVSAMRGLPPMCRVSAGDSIRFVNPDKPDVVRRAIIDDVRVTVLGNHTLTDQLVYVCRVCDDKGQPGKRLVRITDIRGWKVRRVGKRGVK